MSVTALVPTTSTIKPLSTSAHGVDLKFVDDDYPTSIDKTGFAVPIFTIDNQDYVLIKSVALYWGYPSSYQLIVKLIKKGGIDKSHVLKTNSELNRRLFELNVISETDIVTDLFYISLPLLYSKIEEKDLFYATGDAEGTGTKDTVNDAPKNDNEHEDDDDEDPLDDEEEDEVDDMDEDEDGTEKSSSFNKHFHKRSTDSKYNNDEKITIGQVFHQYGLDSTTPLSHALFNSINSVSKLNYYKNFGVSGYRFLPNNKLTFTERDLVLNTNNYSDIHVDEATKPKVEEKKRGFRKPIGKSKKHNLQIDPNTIDLSESVIPGQGYIPDFSVNHICKVPNYYVTSNHQSLPQSFNTKNLNSSSNSSFMFNDNVRIKSKNIQQLVFSNDSDNYQHSKYYYTKTYRGPGSGNYKDGALMNKINKIHFSSHGKPCHKKRILNNNRYNKSLKGLTHERFDKDFVENLLAEQRKYAEDYSNLEMLHNNLQFNVLLNTYRNIAQDTWHNYYKFKLVDFEQLRALQVEAEEIEERKRAAERHNDWIEEEKLRQERLRMIFEDEKSEYQQLHNESNQKTKELQEKMRRRQLEASLSDSFGGDNENANKDATELAEIQQEFETKRNELKEKFENKKKDLMNPIPPPQPIETPQLELNNKFTSPAAYPEILRNLPLELRGTSQETKDDVPSIKKPIRYVTTYPEGSNPQYLTRIEIIKLPNSNAVGWDNLKKYKD
ncbi:hypothetical protein SBY92_002032 [Candida maltosa Xu316]